MASRTTFQVGHPSIKKFYGILVQSFVFTGHLFYFDKMEKFITFPRQTTCFLFACIYHVVNFWWCYAFIVVNGMVLSTYTNTDFIKYIFTRVWYNWMREWYNQTIKKYNTLAPLLNTQDKRLRSRHYFFIYVTFLSDW